MKRILLVCAFALVTSACNDPDLGTRQGTVRKRADEALDQSVIRCKDGRQLRVTVLNPWSTAESIAVWPMTNDDGKPLHCVKKTVDRPADYEEVPDADAAPVVNGGTVAQ